MKISVSELAAYQPIMFNASWHCTEPVHLLSFTDEGSLWDKIEDAIDVKLKFPGVQLGVKKIIFSLRM